jgi:hypothetical protein
MSIEVLSAPAVLPVGQDLVQYPELGNDPSHRLDSNPGSFASKRFSAYPSPTPARVHSNNKIQDQVGFLMIVTRVNSSVAGAVRHEEKGRVENTRLVLNTIAYLDKVGGSPSIFLSDDGSHFEPGPFTPERHALRDKAKIRGSKKSGRNQSQLTLSQPERANWP